LKYLYPVITKSELELIFSSCPFPYKNKVSSYFTMLSEILEQELIDKVSKQSFPNEEFAITENCIYIHYALGARKSKLGVNWFKQKLKVKATVRNYRTMAKLIQLASD